MDKTKSKTKKKYNLKKTITTTWKKSRWDLNPWP